jgi:membrane protease YdiL (CAAX protease family)
MVEKEGWSAHLRGHLLQFGGIPAPTHTARAGVRLVVLAGVLEVVRLGATTLVPGIPLWLMTPLLLGLALALVRPVAELPLSQIGLRPWREWSVVEQSYSLQVVVLACVVFPIVLGSPFVPRGSQPGGSWRLWHVFVPYLFFGFYQELTYRGMIQLELVRRWGSMAGILAANALYTFGPLHWGYVGSPPSVAAPMFAAIFAVGMFFGFLYRRSGNLWIVGVFHALGNAYIVSSIGPAR